jgi:hypothetical protein
MEEKQFLRAKREGKRSDQTAIPNSQLHLHPSLLPSSLPLSLVLSPFLLFFSSKGHKRGT